MMTETVPAQGVPRSMATELLDQLDARGYHPAVVEARSGRVRAAAEVAAAIRQVGAGLRRVGFGPGTTVVIAAPPSHEWLVTAVAALAVGATLAPGDARLSDSVVRRRLVATGAQVVVTIAPLVPWVQRAARGLPVELLVIGDNPAASLTYSELASTTDQLHLFADPDAPAVRWPAASMGQQDIVVTQRQLMASAALVGFVLSHHGEPEAPSPSRGPVLLGAPWSTPLGLAAAVQCLRAGLPVLLGSGDGPGDLTRTVNRHRPGGAVLSARQMLMLGRAAPPGGAGLPAVMVAERVPAELLADDGLRARVVRVVGAAGAMPVAIANGTMLAATPGLIGSPAPHTAVRAVDAVTGTDVGVNEIGELYVRGPQVSAADGEWLALGDLVRLDHAGWLHLAH